MNVFQTVGGVNCSSESAEWSGPGRRLHFPLEMIGLDLPGVVGATPRWVDFNLTSVGPFTGDYINASSVPPFYVVRYTLTTQNAVYSLVTAIATLALVLVSLLMAGALLLVIARDRKRVDVVAAGGDEESAAAGRGGGDLSGLGSLTASSRLTAEQGTCLLLLVFLVAWQNPIRSACIIAHYLSVTSLSDSALLAAGLSGSLASYGLLFAAVVYVNGLKYNSMGGPSAESRPKRSSVLLPNRPASAFAMAAQPLKPLRPSSSSAYEPISWTVPDSVRKDFERQSLDTTPLFLGESSQNSPTALADASTSQWYDAPSYRPLRHRASTEEPFRVWNSLILLVLTWIAASVYWLLKFPSFCASRWLPFDPSLVGTRLEGNTAYMITYMVVESVVIVLSLVWVYCVLQALYSTASRLRRSRFMRNRYHQIAYVLLLTQINLGVVLLVAVLVWEVIALHVVSSEQYQFGSSLWLWLGYAVRLFEYCGGLRAIASAAPMKAPHMELVLFASFLVYSIVYLAAQHMSGSKAPVEGDTSQRSLSLLPARRSSLVFKLERNVPLLEMDAADQSHRLERRNAVHQQLKRSLIERKYASFLKRYVSLKCVVGERHPFCLETACLLLEASYQTYFPVKDGLHGVVVATSKVESIAASTAAPLGPFLDLARLDLELKSTFADAQLATFGYFGENLNENRAVAAFRGSTLANIATDFKFALIALPQLKQSRRFFIRIVRQATALTRAKLRSDLLSSDMVAIEGEPSSESEDLDAVLNSSWVSALSSRSQSVDPQDQSSHRTALLNAFADHSLELNLLPDFVVAGADDQGGEHTVLGHIQAAGAAIPLVKQGFPRVHAGFWAAYASVREQFLAAAVMSIMRHRQSHLSDLLGDSSSSAVWSASSAGEISGAAGDIEMANVAQRQGYGSTDMDRPSSLETVSPRRSVSVANHELQLEFSVMDPLRISITGHSLGGAMAVLAALDLTTNMSTIAEALCCEDYFHPALAEGLSHLSQLRAWVTPVISVYVYGSPRLGNAALMSLVNRNVPCLYRVQVNGDLVTMVPKIAGFYRHVGTTVVVDDEESGGLVLNPSLLEQIFLRRTTGTLANHSLDRYRACLEACFERDELDEYRTKEFLSLSRAQQQQREKEGIAGGTIHSAHSSAMPDWLACDRD
eukprot:gene27973-34763_t